MSEKRFTTKNIICSNYCVWDNNDKPYGNDEVVDLLNELAEENEQLRKQCFELEKDYLIETSDISDKIYLKDEINELKKRYGVKDE